MFKKNIVTNEEVKKFEIVKEELSKAIELAIGHRSVSTFIKDCGMVDATLIANILHKKIKVLPDKKLFRIIEKTSEKRVTYSYLCQICDYPEYDVDDTTWRNYYPERGSIYMIDLGFNNLDSEQNGIRPCLIISNNTGNKNSYILSIAPLTTKTKKPMPTHVPLMISDGMRQNSLICIEQTRVVSKRRLFYNRVPIKIMDLSEEKIFEVNTAIEKTFGLLDCLFNNEVAFELIEQIKNIENNKKIKKSSLLNGIYERLSNYCRKYNRDVNRVIDSYEKIERNEDYVYATI